MMKKKFINSDGQQFHQYQQPPLTLSHGTQKSIQHIVLEIQYLARNRKKDVNGIKILPLG